MLAKGMKSFATSTAIRAAPQSVWAILTDTSAYAALDPAITKVEGRIAAGERVVLHTSDRTFKLRVTSFEPGKQMVWTGGMPLGLFTGTRVFQLTPQADGRVEFAMREDFTGLLAPLISRSIPDLQPNFDQFAANLKKRAEGSA